jgi:hypothetical protein
MATTHPTPEHESVQGLAAIEAGLEENERAWKTADDSDVCSPRKHELLAQAVAAPIATRADARMKLAIALSYDTDWEEYSSAYELCRQVHDWLARLAADPPAA